MSRAFIFASIVLASGMAHAAEVAPPPREVGAPEPIDPAKRVERIIRTARDVGDRLAQLDPGRETRGKQGDILQDIDELIRQQDQPPMPMDPSPMSDPMPKQGSSDQQPKSGSRPSPGLPQDSSQSDRPPLRPQRNRPQPAGGKERNPMPEPVAGKEPTEKGKEAGKEPSSKGGASGVASAAPPKPLMPLAGDFEKDVWGHLPEQLRQQVSSYYRQQFMPQYAELLRHYYSSLAERESKTSPPSR